MRNYEDDKISLVNNVKLFSLTMKYSDRLGKKTNDLILKRNRSEFD